MATTKGRTPTTTRTRTTTPRATPAKPKSFVDTTTATVKKRPVASAAIVGGTLSALAGAAFGFFAWKKSGKSFSDFSGDIATSVKDKASETSERVKELADDATTYVKDAAGEATTFVKDGVSDVTAKAKEFADRRKDGVEPAPTFPTDPVVDSQTKTGAISY